MQKKIKYEHHTNTHSSALEQAKFHGHFDRDYFLTETLYDLMNYD